MVPREDSNGSWHDGVDRAAEGSQGPRPPPSGHAHLADLHALLVEDRERTSERIRDLTQDVTSIVEGTRLTATDDEHDPEGSTIAFERSQTSALLTAATAHLAEVDAALGRIADGTYGRCERCGEPVPDERLLARPAARTCITCADGRARARPWRESAPVNTAPPSSVNTHPAPADTGLAFGWEQPPARPDG